MLSLSLLALSYTIPPLGNVLNVKDFGAKGDGTTDDTASIKAAIDHAKAMADYRSVSSGEGCEYPAGSLFDLDEPGKDPTGAVSQTGLHVPYYRSGTSKNWYYAARAA